MTIDLFPPGDLSARAEAGAFIETHAMKTAGEWWESGAWGLVMLGPVGNGKSQAMVWLREQMLRKSERREVVWIRSKNLEQLSWDERHDLVGRCKRARYLLIDELPTAAELDAKKVQALTVSTISDIFEAREDARGIKRTVATGNDSRGGFGRLWGDRLVSRLRHGGLDTVNDRGPDGKPRTYDRVRWLVDVEGRDLRGDPSLPPLPAPTEAKPDPEPNFEGLAAIGEKVTALFEEAEANERAKRATLDSQAKRAREADDSAREVLRRRVWGGLALEELAAAALRGEAAACDVLDAVARRAAGGSE